VRITIGADHAGFELKEAVKAHLEAAGHAVRDAGAYSTDCVDYPLIAASVAGDVGSGAAEAGVLVCGSGIGMAIAANKVRGVRATPVYEVELAELTRRHNDANIVSLAGRRTDQTTAFAIVDTFLATPFEGGRHQRRVDQITDMECQP
jgi:ribose 5-phosphate isomerase B